MPPYVNCSFKPGVMQGMSADKALSLLKHPGKKGTASLWRTFDTQATGGQAYYRKLSEDTSSSRYQLPSRRVENVLGRYTLALSRAILQGREVEPRYSLRKTEPDISGDMRKRGPKKARMAVWRQLGLSSCGGGGMWDRKMEG